MVYYTCSAQNFSQSNLDYNGFSPVNSATSLTYGPDGRLYTLDIDGQINIYSILRIAKDNYQVTASETLNYVKNLTNHDDDGSVNNSVNIREATGLTVAGTANNPVIYVTSSDSRIGGPSGDLNLDTNSGIISRLMWNGGSWVAIDLVRGLPRSEENHATNGLEYVTINGSDYLIVCSGGHTNAGSPSDNFAWTTEYALSAAILSVNLTMLEGMSLPYDIPTLDDPTRDNVHANGSAASEDPNSANYSPIDINDPFGGNDGLNQAMIVPGGPVQIFSPGYRNAYDLVVTENGRVYVTDNGPNGGWGGLPQNEGGGSVTNQYLSNEPGSSSSTGGEQVNNRDHLTKVTDNIQTYTFGSFYGGHPSPIRANPNGAGLYTNPGVNSISSLAYFRTNTYDPNGSTPGSTSNVNQGLPANWPPVPTADPIQGDFRSTGDSNPEGTNDIYVTTWSTNTNGIDEYTASNFGGAMKGNLIAGKSGGKLFRVALNGSGNLASLNESFQTNLGGNPLGVTCNGDNDPHPGTIWVATFNGNIKVLEPADAINCYLPGHPSYSASGDNDADGYTNQDEIDNRGSQTIESVICSPGNQPNDFDKDAGGNLVSDLNDHDDDNDGIPDSNDPFQLGDFLTGGTDAFNLPIINELFSDNSTLQGYLGLGLTGMMNNGATSPNWLDWIDLPGDGPNPNDLLGGAVGAMTMHMGSGTALGSTNNQRKAFQYGVNVDQSTGGFIISGRLFNFHAPLQLYHTSSPVDGELGIFMGDGTQSNYIKLVLKKSGIRFQQEINDVAQTPIDLNISAGNRPQDPNDNVIFKFSVNPETGSVQALYSFDQGNSFQTVGIISAQGSILQAIQNSNTPLAVGLIGTSNQSNVELEGSWDYLKVEGSQPTIEQVFPDINVAVNAPNNQFNLDNYFNDNDGDANLDYNLQYNSNSAINAFVSGNTLTLDYPNSEENASIIIRATDQNGLYVQQSFQVNVADDQEPTSIIRIRPGGSDIADTPTWQGIPNTGSYVGQNFSVNTGNIAGEAFSNRHASLPAYVPMSLFNKERWDNSDGPEMQFDINLTNAEYKVRLYLGNWYSGTNQVGERIFDIRMEGQIVENNFDPVARFGNETGGMVEHDVVVNDGTLNILFEHEVENPNVYGIEVLGYPVAIQPISNMSNESGDLINMPVYASGGKTGSYQFTASGLPDGIQIEPSTGLVFGTLTTNAAANSPYNPEITVIRNGSIPATTTFNWAVAAQTWHDQSDDENYTARHECSFVQAGDKFYLMGGRESPKNLDIYDFGNKTWSTISNSAPKEFNHFQATEYNGLIWIICAFKDNGFPNEAPEENIWMYNPANDEWIEGPAIPANRRRGSAGIGVYNDKFYIVGGNTIGHNGGYVSWFDEFDPATGQWTQLIDAPRTRDHFHAQVIGDKFYVAGGRRSGGAGGTFAPLIAEVDVYDFNTSQWTSVADIPTPRAAPAVANLGGKLYVMGGEIQTDLNGQSVNDAVKTTESFDPSTGQWSTEANLITERHGTQAIVSGTGIHVTSGSDKLGGGRIKKMEYFGDDNPSGSASDACELTGPSSLEVPIGGTLAFNLSAVNGNVGVALKGISISGTNAAEFSTDQSFSFAFLKAGTSKNIIVYHNGSQGGKSATLNVAYDDGVTLGIPITTAEDLGSLQLTLELQGKSDHSGPVLVQLCNASNQQIINSSFTADANGNISVPNIPVGSYKLYLGKTGYLRKAVTNLSIAAGSNSLSLLESQGKELRAGDINNSNSVNNTDLNLMKSGYYFFSGNASFDADLDLNSDGGVTIEDYSILASNYGNTGKIACSGTQSQSENNNVSMVNLKTTPASISLAENEISSFYIAIENAGNVPVDGIDIRMVYDAGLLEVLEVVDVYGWSDVLMSEIVPGNSRFHFAGGTTGNGPSNNRNLLKVKVRAISGNVTNTSFYFDRSAPMMTEVAAKGYPILDQVTGLNIDLLGSCVETRMISHTPIIDASFLAGQKIMVMGNSNVVNSAIFDAPIVEINGNVVLPPNVVVSVKKDGCE
ncbi:Kelch repeat-containing protein [Portibacter lacus]|uniref:Malectin domain-containing protein n=1 Tax=Portibacter lacus TaxID=1099794 RepID=A0AA37SSJ3_9BACT|nr:malectin domain-containing carbohydrate-binding protein [Portibacter lacus]GLR17991.1 hypothetical protein GCM10007940_26060 [Portibacter lacus]